MINLMWVFDGHSSKCSACVACLQHAAIIISADTPLNSNNKLCLFHFQ